jgi:glyoxylase I family protein
LDHIVLNYKDDGSFNAMFQFYTEVLGCSVDSQDDIGRMGGKLTHLRAGPNTMIDLMKLGESNDNGNEAELVSTITHTNLNHFCLRIDTFDSEALEAYFKEEKFPIQSQGLRQGAEGVGPSIYIQDPLGNVVELKGPNKVEKEEENENNICVLENVEADVVEVKSADKDLNVIHDKKQPPLTPCTRICRYNAGFFGGQVCIGCYRETYEIGNWSSMSPSEKYWGLLDAIDRLEENKIAFDGAISLEDLKRQADYWRSLASS